MAKVFVNETNLRNIGDAIREKNGSNQVYLPSEMADAIEDIPTGTTPTGNINITDMQQTDVSAYATAQVVDSDLIAGNIKKNVDILGVVGTYEGSGGGTTYPVIDALYSGAISNGSLKVLAPAQQSMQPESNAIQQAISSNFTIALIDESDGTKAGGEITITPSQLDLEGAVSDFIDKYLTSAAAEYAGYIYGTNIVTTLGLTLLGDFSSGGNVSGNTLLDSIANYSGVILQGVYKTQQTSSYNSSFLYQNISLNKTYYAGMKDRNNSYKCPVTFTANDTVSLAGNKQVIIYGID